MLKAMKNSKYLFGLLMGLLIVSCNQTPDFYYANGKSGHLTDFRGQWIIINYWADWCKPCIEEVPELNRFYSQYKKEYQLLALSFDNTDNETLKQQIIKHKIQYPMLASMPKPKLGLQLPAVLPSNIIISPSGVHYGPLVGPQTAESLIAAIKKYQQQEQNKNP